jgi:phosphoribosylamine--glycine ligase
MKKYNVLLLGSGAREHTFAFKISKSPILNKLFVAPGNAGTSQISENLNISDTDFEKVKLAIIEKNINLLVVGSETPLVEGIVDFLKQDVKLKELLIIGPTALGAKLEGSKEWSKNFMTKFNIPTAKWKSFTKQSISEAFEFLESLQSPYVLKASGLASGKGVLIVDDLDSAKNELQQMFDGKFGDASTTVVIEEYLNGIELSVFVLTDGDSYKILPTAKDYKRIGVDDTGLNTGGMGSVSPVPFADNNFMKLVKDTIIDPTFWGLKNEELDYCGFIFIGLMNCNGVPKVIEYNCRMGDPETQSVFSRIESDLLTHLIATANKCLYLENIQISEKSAVTVVLASGGYPQKFETGFDIKIDNALEMVNIFHGGTKNVDGNLQTSGGRVLSITATGDTILDAKEKAYLQINGISYKNKYFRTDISDDLVNIYQNELH